MRNDVQRKGSILAQGPKQLIVADRPSMSRSQIILSNVTTAHPSSSREMLLAQLYLNGINAAREERAKGGACIGGEHVPMVVRHERTGSGGVSRPTRKSAHPAPLGTNAKCFRRKEATGKGRRRTARKKKERRAVPRDIAAPRTGCPFIELNALTKRPCNCQREREGERGRLENFARIVPLFWRFNGTFYSKGPGISLHPRAARLSRRVASSRCTRA